MKSVNNEDQLCFHKKNVNSIMYKNKDVKFHVLKKVFSSKILTLSS